MFPRILKADNPAETLHAYRAWLEQQPEDTRYGVHHQDGVATGPRHPSSEFREAHPAMHLFSKRDRDPLWHIVMEEIYYTFFRRCFSEGITAHQLLALLDLVQTILWQCDQPEDALAGWHFRTKGKHYTLKQERYLKQMEQSMLEEAVGLRTPERIDQIAYTLLVLYYPYEYIGNHTRIQSVVRESQDASEDACETILLAILAAPSSEEKHHLFRIYRETSAIVVE